MKRVADARVGADALAHELDVGADFVGQVGDLVHEADARGQHRVGGVFGEFGAPDVHDAGALVVAVEGQVELAHEGQRALALGRGGVHAEHDAVGAHEVVDRGALLQEFGVGDDGEPGDRFETPRAPSSAWMAARTLSAVPTGTVDLSTTTLKPVMCRPMLRAAASTYCRSALPSSSGGVPTA
jgi:hypothetical protein